MLHQSLCELFHGAVCIRLHENVVAVTVFINFFFMLFDVAGAAAAAKQQKWLLMYYCDYIEMGGG